ncbi:CLUMA_CG008404, isoform A [Clunio marinus]|uniref:CLUMA_CG008404, isoform A n=1 Tax=Clunio marinus TaxID=568069 RepID=A0A1J1I3M6_9DIPT|nr:CLUMA_CG008404, isoform A [Clunio marinus]
MSLKLHFLLYPKKIKNLFLFPKFMVCNPQNNDQLISDGDAQLIRNASVIDAFIPAECNFCASGALFLSLDDIATI